MLSQNVQLGEQLLSVVCLLGVTLYTPGSLARAAEKGNKEVELVDSPAQVVIGGSSELKVFGNDLTLVSVEIAPPEGATVSDIKETTPDPEDARQRKAGVKVWAFKASVAKGTQPGKRSIVFVNQKGRTEPQEVRVCTHLPKISDLTLLSASSSSAKVKFLVSDNAGDVTPQSPPDFAFTAICLPAFITSQVGKGANVIAKDAKSAVVEATFSAPYPNHLSEDCELWLTITDKEGYESNRLKTKVKFK